MLKQQIERSCLVWCNDTYVHDLADVALGAAERLGQLVLERGHLLLEVVPLSVELSDRFVFSYATAHEVYVLHVFVK